MFLALSFARIWARCTSTVRRLIFSSSAVARLDDPEMINGSTVRSRAVRSLAPGNDRTSGRGIFPLCCPLRFFAIASRTRTAKVTASERFSIKSCAPRLIASTAVADVAACGSDQDRCAVVRGVDFLEAHREPNSSAGKGRGRRQQASASARLQRKAAHPQNSSPDSRLGRTEETACRKHLDLHRLRRSRHCIPRSVRCRSNQ